MSIHREAFEEHLKGEMSKESNMTNYRRSAREKLTNLSKRQFQELSVDAYDEMNRRELNENLGM